MRFFFAFPVRRDSSRLLKNYSRCTVLCGTKGHARRRSAAESHVQLLVARDARAERSSTASDSGHGGRSAPATFSTLRIDVRPSRPTVDSAGEAVAGAVAADAVFDPQRAIADGRNGLQPAVPMVRGVEGGRRSLGREHLY